MSAAVAKAQLDGLQLCSHYIRFSRSCEHVDKARGCLKMKHTETLKRHQTGTCSADEGCR